MDEAYPLRVAEEDDLPALAQGWSDGDTEAFDRLVEVFYDDLRAIAHRHLRSEGDNRTLTTTALVHEAYAELCKRTRPEWRGRAPFFALISRVMRHVIVDFARRRHAAKRGGLNVRVPLDESAALVNGQLVDLLALSDALDWLEAREARLARVVECRFFGGMSESEIAEALGVSTRTVERDWQRARALLFTVLGAERRADGDEA